MEIGSIYEINPRVVEVARREHTQSLQLKEVLKYKKEYVKYTGSGREAIALALKSLEECNPHIVKKCLLPAYMCDTVFFPFINAGWELFFYHIGKNLEAKEEELLRLIEHIRPGLLFIHSYYGTDTWKPMRSLLKEIRKQGVYIMDDVTQSYYMDHPDISQTADYIIGSLRKWYAVPDGGFVVSNLPLPDIAIENNSTFSNRRLELLTEKWQYLYEIGYGHKEKRMLKEEYLRKNKDTEEWLDCFTGIHFISEISQSILSHIEEAECKKRRSDNYNFLYEALEGRKSISLVCRKEEGAAPLYLPVYVDNREELQAFLTEHDIYAPILWPIGTENQQQLSKEEQYIFAHLLALPIDQRYGMDEMERIVEVINAYERV